MKKLNKFFAILVALAMMATLCVSMAFAEGELTDAQKSADALLVKYLKLAEGETKPNATFNFEFAGQETSTITADEANAAKPTNVQIASSAMSATVYDGDGATEAKALKIADLFDLTKFEKAGVYKYEVTETAGEASIDNGTMTYDSTKYIINIFVKNGTSGPEIANITVQEGTDAAEKEDATNDPTDNSDPDVTTEKDFSDEGCSFVNSYTSDVTKDNEDGILKVSKTVKGDYGDKTQKFPFTLTLKVPAEADQAYVASYTEAGETKTATAVNGVITINAKLADGEAVVFKTLPAGTTYETSEALDATVKNADKYTAEVDLTDVDTDKTNTKAENPGAGVSANGLVRDTDAKNIAAYTNTYADDETTPTGILINNLPYIVLALVAVGGMVAYVVSRRKEEE